MLPVASKPSVPQRAPAIPEPQRAAGVAAKGKLRAVRRRVRALEKAASSSDHDARLRALEKAASSSDQDARLRAREMAASTSDHDARLRALEKAASSSDQAEQIKTFASTLTQFKPFASALGQIKTPSADQDRRLRALKKVASSSDHDARLRALEDRFDGVHRDLGGLKPALDKIYNELDEAANRTSGLWRDLRGPEEEVRLPRGHVRPRCPSPSWHATASDQHSRLGKTVDELSARVDRIVRDMGCVWGQKWRDRHEFENS